MSNTSRKLRKRSGEKFVRVPKVGTPIEERFVPIVLETKKLGLGLSHPSHRALKKRAEAIAIRDVDKPVEVVAPKRTRAKKAAA